MVWLIVFLCLIGHFSLVKTDCSLPQKFYVDCSGTRTANAANQFCLDHGMILVNLTNGTTSLFSDISVLNSTFKSGNCNGNFWYSSGTRTKIVASTNALGDLLSVLTDLLGTVLCIIPYLCPPPTTPAPIVDAFTVCTRPIQQRVIHKCSTGFQRSDMQAFRFREQSMYAGVLNTFSLKSTTACSGLCSSNDACIGMLYTDRVCTLYM
ncbi:hypothetical protein I4U23_002624 [Adineta vaga]|nr:hypothetical protein I4U23_002624 [Adineta vaga]